MEEFVLAIAESESVEDVWSLFCARMAAEGFDRVLFGVTRFQTGTSLGDPRDFTVLSNHAPAYLDAFLGEELYRDAPLFHWALNNRGARSWRLIGEMEAAGKVDPRMRRTIEFNRAHGVIAGYTLSIGDAASRWRAIFALTARPGLAQHEVDAIWDARGDSITAMCHVVNLRFGTLPLPSAGRRLTRRQREALYWVGQGKTVRDIAQIMELTPATVEKHLRLAREALDVETTAQAVLKAAIQNQIDMRVP